MTASGLTIAAIMGAMLLVFIFSGYYLFAALGGAAIISGLIFWGPNVFQTIYFSVFKYCKDYNLLAVPLFVLMGQLLNQSGVAGRLFDNLSVALGRQRGGMAIAATLIAILFAATTGIVGASVVSMGLLFTKPMLDAKYNKSLTAGVIISGGTLGILIPPSIMLVFMGSAANVSVGKLFYGAMTPGVLLGVAYIVYVKVISIVKKDYAPPMPEEVLSRYSKKQIAWGIVVNVLPVAIVIFSVLGAIWFGWCPATEAAALGVAASFIIALCTHSINKQVIKKTLVESIKLTSMVYAVSAFGNLFVTVFMRLGCSSAVTSLFGQPAVRQVGHIRADDGRRVPAWLPDGLDRRVYDNDPNIRPHRHAGRVPGGILPHHDGRHYADRLPLAAYGRVYLLLPGRCEGSHYHSGNDTRRLAVHGAAGACLYPVHNLPADSDLAAQHDNKLRAYKNV